METTQPSDVEPSGDAEPDAAVVVDATPDSATPADDAPEAATPADDAPGDAPDDATPADDAPEAATLGDGTPADGTPADGTPEAATPADGTPEAATPADGTQQRSRRRVRPWTLFIPVVTAIAGLMFAMSFHAAQGNDLRPDRDLPQLILDANEHVAARNTQLGSLQKQVDELSKASAPRDARLGALSDKADRFAVTAGRTSVTGPGLSVSLTDSKATLDMLPSQYTADDIVVHQQDVQAVVNAMWAGGAEAMMIQDQRVITTSAVRCVGNTLILQGRVYSPPYVIKAIGNVNRMEQALAADPTIQIYQQYVAAVGLGWEVTTQPSATFPAFAGPVDLSYAQVIP